MRRSTFCLSFLLPVALLAAEPERPASSRSAAEELEAELDAQVKISGPELVIVTDGPDPDRYALTDATIALDGSTIPGRVVPGWGQRFYAGALAPGNHVLTAEFVYRADRTGPYPWSDAYGFRVPGKVEFQAQRGLRLIIHLRVETHDDAENARGKLAFRAALEPEMIGKVDDSPVPPPRRPVLLTPVPEVATPVASIPETPVKPTVVKKKKKRSSVASGASGAASLDVATARLQKAIATPSTPPPKRSTGKSRADAGTP